MLAEEAGLSLIHLALAFTLHPSRPSPRRSSALGRWSSSSPSWARRRHAERRRPRPDRQDRATGEHAES